MARSAVIPGEHDIVLAGGLVQGDESTDRSFRLVPDRHRVRPLPPLAVPVHDTAGVRVQGRSLVIGGGNAREQDAVQEWDGSQWRVVGHLPQPRSDLVAATVSGHVYVLGGYSGLRPAEPDILQSTTGRRWTVAGRLPRPVRYPACAALDGAIWLFGGESGGSMHAEIQRFDPTSGRASVVGHLPGPVGHAVAFSVGRRVLIAGGRTSQTTVTDRMWWFDPRTHAVTRAGRLPSPLADASGAEVGGVGYLVGGETPSLNDGVIAMRPRTRAQ
jgi:hypothetical protein